MEWESIWIRAVWTTCAVKSKTYIVYIYYLLQYWHCWEGFTIYFYLVSMSDMEMSQSGLNSLPSLSFTSFLNIAVSSAKQQIVWNKKSNNQFNHNVKKNPFLNIVKCYFNTIVERHLKNDMLHLLWKWCFPSHFCLIRVAVIQQGVTKVKAQRLQVSSGEVRSSPVT